MPNLLTRYPALSAALGQLAVTLILAFGVHLDVTATAAVEACTAAGLGLVVAAFTRPFAYSAVTGFLLAGLACLAAFKIRGITPGLLSAVNAAFAAFAFKLTHQAVTPVVPQAAPQHSAP